MGLLGMEERVSHLGGTFAIESQAGQGSVLRVTLPLVGAAV
jgi:signal transduction histidine kinase